MGTFLLTSTTPHTFGRIGRQKPLTIWRSFAHFNLVKSPSHQNTEHSQAILKAQKLQHEITAMYDLRGTFSPIIQSYFSMPLDKCLRRSFRQKQGWLRLIRLATSPATSQRYRKQVISSYFPHAPSNTTFTRDISPTVIVPFILLTFQKVPFNKYRYGSISLYQQGAILSLPTLMSNLYLIRVCPQPPATTTCIRLSGRPAT